MNQSQVASLVGKKIREENVKKKNNFQSELMVTRDDFEKMVKRSSN